MYPIQNRDANNSAYQQISPLSGTTPEASANSIYPNLAEPSAPPAHSPEYTGKGKIKVYHFRTLRDHIAEKASSHANTSRDVPTHAAYERGLWVANCFIIPLIVYPIMSLIGHIFIEIQRDRHVEKYKDIKKYLDENDGLWKKDLPLQEHVLETILIKLTGENDCKRLIKYGSINSYISDEVKQDPLYQTLVASFIPNSKEQYKFYY